VVRVDLADGTTVVAKANRVSLAPLFDEESEGLLALAKTDTVLVPTPIGVSDQGEVAVFLMTWIESGRPDSAAWEEFGRDLASLHGVVQSSGYGFHRDNHIGTTMQPNGWTDDWVEFNRHHRIGFQIELAARTDKLATPERKTLEKLNDRLGEWLPSNPPPALLHGDLWSGNGLPATHEGRPRIAVVDPAPYVGDGWADIAMMKLFGGFPEECHRAYAESVSDHDDIAERIAIYQLYHVLNHVNIFGASYLGQALAIARSLGV